MKSSMRRKRGSLDTRDEIVAFMDRLFPSLAWSSVAIRPDSLVPAVFRLTTYCFCYPRSRQATPHSESLKEPLEERVQAEVVP